MIGIHPIHRKLAEIIHMHTDRNGVTHIGWPEVQLILPLLRQNMLLVQRLDELKQLAYAAQLGGDLDWVQEISRQIDEMEVQML